MKIWVKVVRFRSWFWALILNAKLNLGRTQDSALDTLIRIKLYFADSVHA